MRNTIASITLAALCALPSVSFAAHFGSPCGGGSCSIHAGVSTQYLVTGNAVTTGYAYYDIYDGTTFMCETNSSNNSPIWSCYASLSTLGSHTINAVVKGTSNLHAPGDNASMTLTVIP